MNCEKTDSCVIQLFVKLVPDWAIFYAFIARSMLSNSKFCVKDKPDRFKCLYS